MRTRSISQVVLPLVLFSLVQSRLPAQEVIVTPEEWHNLLNNKQIRGELEITNAQVNELDQRLEMIENNFAIAGPADPIKHFFVMQRLKSLTDPDELELAQIAEDRQRTKARNDLYNAGINSAAQEILLPFQIERLRQLTCWQLINENGYATFLEWALIRRAIDPEHQQSGEINEIARKLQNEFEQDLDELRAKYREKLNQALTAEQVQKLKDIFGDGPKEPKDFGKATLRF